MTERGIWAWYRKTPTERQEIVDRKPGEYLGIQIMNEYRLLGELHRKHTKQGEQ